MASFFLATTLSRLPTPLAFPFRVKSWRKLRLKCCAGSSPQMESDSRSSISLSDLRAGFAGLGLLETGYLTYLKLTDSEAFCPIGGGSCGDVLNSDYSSVFGVPLPLLGMLAYGTVTLLSLQQARKILLSGLNETDSRIILIGTTTSMATASTYFLYLLNTNFAGTTCSYCLVSAFLSFTLFFLTLKDFGLEKVQKFLGLQLAVAFAVFIALNNTYSSVTPQSAGSGEITLERYETEITKESTPYSIALAKHLRSIGAKMYGAFWCSHCNEQKEMFGREAAKIIDYVECFPNGAGKGRTMALECSAAGLEGFPTWFINDQVLSGEQDLSTLADASGFVFENARKPS